MIIGSNNEETRFRLLKVNRTVSDQLILIDDQKEYKLVQILEVSLNKH